MKNQNLSALEIYQRKDSICLLLNVDFLLYMIFKDYSIFCIYIYNILFLNIFSTKQLCYVSVQLIKFLYIFICVK